MQTIYASDDNIHFPFGIDGLTVSRLLSLSANWLRHVKNVRAQSKRIESEEPAWKRRQTRITVLGYTFLAHSYSRSCCSPKVLQKRFRS